MVILIAYVTFQRIFHQLVLYLPSSGMLSSFLPTYILRNLETLSKSQIPPSSMDRYFQVTLIYSFSDFQWHLPSTLYTSIQVYKYTVYKYIICHLFLINRLCFLEQFQFYRRTEQKTQFHMPPLSPHKFPYYYIALMLHDLLQLTDYY